MGHLNLSEAAIAHLRATVPNFGRPAPAGSAKPQDIKREPNVTAAKTTSKAAKASGSRTETSRIKQAPTEKRVLKSDARKPDRKRKPSPKKRQDQDSSPDDSDPNSDSDGEGAGWAVRTV
jgi:hypothetical protein